MLFLDVTKIFIVPGTSSHHCQSGASTRMKLLVVSSCEIGTSNFQISFAFIGVQIGMGHSLEFLSLDSPHENLEIFPSIICYALLVFLD